MVSRRCTILLIQRSVLFLTKNWFARVSLLNYLLFLFFFFYLLFYYWIYLSILLKPWIYPSVHLLINSFFSSFTHPSSVITLSLHCPPFSPPSVPFFFHPTCYRYLLSIFLFQFFLLLFVSSFLRPFSISSLFPFLTQAIYHPFIHSLFSSSQKWILIRQLCIYITIKWLN